MAFSLLGILSVLLEYFRPLLPVLGLLLLAELVMLGWLIANRGSWRARAALGVAGVIAAIVFVGALFGLLVMTGASAANLHGLLDYGMLFGASLALGIAAGAVSYPPLQLLFRNGAGLPRGAAARY